MGSVMETVNSTIPKQLFHFGASCVVCSHLVALVLLSPSKCISSVNQRLCQLSTYDIYISPLNAKVNLFCFYLLEWQLTL